VVDDNLPSGLAAEATMSLLDRARTGDAVALEVQEVHGLNRIGRRMSLQSGPTSVSCGRSRLFLISARTRRSTASAAAVS
jgi:hypothetical protein